MNVAIYETLINAYTTKAYTDQYIMGFRFAKNIWMVKLTDADLPYVMKLDKASRGQGMSLRFKPDKHQKAYMLNKGAQIVCSEDAFEDIKSSSKYNYGETYEKIIAEKNGLVWEKDNIPYTEAGDIEVDGVAYQIKFEKATFTNEKSEGFI